MTDYAEKTRMGRAFLKPDFDDVFVSDQQKRLPQPPLFKPLSSNASVIPLPRGFESLDMDRSILSVIAGRESHRIYTESSVTLLQLSFLLWATQGVKGIRGDNYAALRTVPSGGARHAFETYLVIKNVEGIQSGLYRYLPFDHAIEHIGELPCDSTLAKTVSGQKWVTKAAVVFYWSVIPYRAEWRYGPNAHRVLLIDVGHVCQNLYLACESTGLGTCAIAAYDETASNAMFALDGVEEHIIYVAPVGVVSEADKSSEDEFYAWLKNGSAEPE